MQSGMYPLLLLLPPQKGFPHLKTLTAVLLLWPRLQCSSPASQTCHLLSIIKSQPPIMSPTVETISVPLGICCLQNTCFMPHNIIITVNPIISVNVCHPSVRLEAPGRKVRCPFFSLSYPQCVAEKALKKYLWNQ